MKKVIVKTGKKPENLWEIKEYLHSLYPEARDGLRWCIWASSSSDEGGYGISKDGGYLNYFSEEGIKILRGEGYTVLERGEMVYRKNLEKILKE